MISYLNTLYLTCILKLENPFFHLHVSFQINFSYCIQKKKNKVLQSFVISKIIYYSSLLGSNKSRVARIQTLINTGLFWYIGSFSKNGKTNSEYNDYIRHNSTMSTYALFRDLSIPPTVGICAALQIKLFAKWSKSICIIKDHHLFPRRVNLALVVQLMMNPGLVDTTLSILKILLLGFIIFFICLEGKIPA